MKEPVKPFDWERMLLDDFPWLYLGEVALRTLCMFLILLIALKVSGKRQIKQLSVFELVLVIGLGSAAGDPMFYHDVPMASAIVVFVVMMICYKLVTLLSDKNRRVRETLEGKPVYVIENGCILINNFKDEDLTQDELFIELRLAGIRQLGEVEYAIREPTGEVSIFQFDGPGKRSGLPILPNDLKKAVETISEPGVYGCCLCGNVQTFGLDSHPVCVNCENDRWVKATQ
ncbi:DUF421 domain-containing protein [Spirosoma sp. BT702]|uniref:DUF421 domain-containing protein n=1 Tax=Spirosoma profusum TaxID=2771354 RepID=A0A926XX06_9BACT|nr:DUF421 domain-containing protein [Spirosoma profusum]MBD2699422.1 DUF421 domain-containing protein [Spirosoma profusum]